MKIEWKFAKISMQILGNSQNFSLKIAYKSKPAQTDVHSGPVKIINSLRNIQKSPGLYLYRGQNTPLSLNLIFILLGSLHKFPLHFLVSYHVLTYALSLHFLCSKCSIFLTTYPPLNAICEGSLTWKEPSAGLYLNDFG